MVLSGLGLSTFVFFCHFKLSNRVPPFLNLVLLMIAGVDIFLGSTFILAQKVAKRWWFSGAGLESKEQNDRILSKAKSPPR